MFGTRVRGWCMASDTAYIRGWLARTQGSVGRRRHGGSLKIPGRAGRRQGLDSRRRRPRAVPGTGRGHRVSRRPAPRRTCVGVRFASGSIGAACQRTVRGPAPARPLRLCDASPGRQAGRTSGRRRVTAADGRRFCLRARVLRSQGHCVVCQHAAVAVPGSTVREVAGEHRSSTN